MLKSFRRCEEQLDSAIKEEAANDAVWDSAGGLSDVPGASPLQSRESDTRGAT